MATEYKLQQALDEVISGRTTFVIAHRALDRPKGRP